MDKYPLSTIARLLGCADADLQALVRRGKIPESADGYDLPTPIQAYCQFLREQTEDGQKARLAKAKAEKAELELDMKRKAYMPVDQVQAAIRGNNDKWLAALGGLDKAVFDKIVRAYTGVQALA